MRLEMQLERAQRYRMALFDMHKPSIAQVHGYCLAGGNDLALLRSLRPQTAAAPFVLLDQRDIAENRDGCCNHSLGRAAREYAWHSHGLHGLKYTVFDRERLPARVCWGLLVLALFVAAVCVSASASRFLLSQPSVYVAVDKVRRTDLEKWKFELQQHCFISGFS